MRTLGSGLSSLFAGAHASLAYLVYLDIEGDPLYATTADRNLAWNGHTYQAVGALGSVETSAEGEALEANGVKLTISGVNTDNISIALGANYQGRTAIVYVAGLDTSGQLVGDPVIVFRGFMDTMSIAIDESTARIDVACEHRLVDWARPRIRRYNDADQQAAYPGDLGLQFVAQLTQRPIIWPSKKYFEK